MATPVKKRDKIESKFMGLTLAVKIKNEDGKEDTISMRWQVKEGYPRIIVHMGEKAFEAIPGKTKKKKNYDYIITAPFVDLKLLEFMEDVKELLEKKEKGSSVEHECNNNVFVNNQRTSEMYTQATVICGICEKGEFYFRIKNDKHDATFPMEPKNAYNVIKHNGVPKFDNPAKASRDAAKAYIRKLLILMDNEIVATQLHRELVKAGGDRISLDKNNQTHNDGYVEDKKENADNYTNSDILDNL